MVQWLRFHTANAEDLGSIPDWELRSHMPCGVCKKIKKKKKERKKENKCYVFLKVTLRCRL